MRTGVGNRLTKQGKKRPKCFGSCIKKKRKKKVVRKRIRKLKVICDTTIWYGIGANTITPISADSNTLLIPTYVVLDELVYSNRSIYNLGFLKEGIKAVQKRRKDLILYPPMIYFLKLINSSFNYNSEETHKDILEAAKRFAEGEEIIKGKEQAFEELLNNRKEGLIQYCDSVNEIFSKVKEKFADRGEKEQENISVEIKWLLGEIIKLSEYSNFRIPKDFKWSKIELFIKTFGQMLIELASTKKKLQANDLFDIFQLLYVKPGVKFWTKDQTLKRLINAAGQSYYLYET